MLGCFNCTGWCALTPRLTLFDIFVMLSWARQTLFVSLEMLLPTRQVNEFTVSCILLISCVNAPICLAKAEMALTIASSDNGGGVWCGQRGGNPTSSTMSSVNSTPAWFWLIAFVDGGRAGSGCNSSNPVSLSSGILSLPSMVAVQRRQWN
jgi:hypothetical protein